MPPQPANAPRPIISPKAKRAGPILRRFLQPNQQNAIAKAPPDAPGHRSDGLLEAAFALSATVSVVVAGAPLGFIVLGEKLHESLDGSPEQLNVMPCEKPFVGVAVRVVVELSPEVSVNTVVERAMEKSAGGRLMTNCAMPVALFA